MVVLILGYALLQSPQDRKSGENRYSFSMPLWFALSHHFLWKKRWHMLFWGTTGYAIFGKKRPKKFMMPY